MVKIICKVLSGYRQMKGDWSPHPDSIALEKYYSANKKNFKVDYTFELQGVNIKVTNISEKSKQEINFSFIN
jgi:hypothetical protein